MKSHPDEIALGERREVAWDLPTRVFHWLLAILFVTCLLSGRAGRFDIHFLAGKSLLILILARIAWGFLGSETSLFRNVIPAPGVLRDYVVKILKGIPDNHSGHNPLGGLSVIAMLALLALQACLGLFAIGADGYLEGPLAFLVSYEAARNAAEFHHIVARTLFFLVLLHIAAVLFHVIARRETLVRPMFSGRRRIAAGQEPPKLASNKRALAVIAAAAIVVVCVLELAPVLL